MSSAMMQARMTLIECMRRGAVRQMVALSRIYCDSARCGARPQASCTVSDRHVPAHPYLISKLLRRLIESGGSKEVIRCFPIFAVIRFLALKGRSKFESLQLYACFMIIILRIPAWSSHNTQINQCLKQHTVVEVIQPSAAARCSHPQAASQCGQS